MRVDRSTDTILARATFPNPASALVDGQFVRLKLELGNPQEQVVVPQAALIADQQGVYVFAAENGKAVVRRVKLGDESDTGVVIEQGLNDGEIIIVDGLSLIRPGIEVRVSPSRMLGGS